MLVRTVKIENYSCSGYSVASSGAYVAVPGYSMGDAGVIIEVDVNEYAAFLSKVAAMSPASVITMLEDIHDNGAGSPEVYGTACLINRTGAASVKGKAVSVDMANEFSVVSGRQFDTIGYMAEDGVADGDPVAIAGVTIVDVLVQDGVAVERGDVLISGLVAGTAMVIPPTEDGIVHYFATALTKVVGGVETGSVLSTHLQDDTAYRVMEVAGGIDLIATVPVLETPAKVEIVGQYSGSSAHVIKIQALNYSNQTYEDVGTWAHGTNDAVQTAQEFAMTANHWDSSTGEAKIRLYHAAGGNTAHHFNINRLIVEGSLHSHFRQYGHALETKQAGVGVVVKAVSGLL